MQPHAIDQAKFQELVRRKWTVSLTLTAFMLAIYFGFILLLAFNKEFLAQKMGEHLTMGIPVGLGVIISVWVLTGVYVVWANATYDQAVREIVAGMKGRE